MDAPSGEKIPAQGEFLSRAIPEYWIVDPRDATITVHTLDQPGQTYREAGRYIVGSQAASVLLEGFAVDVRETFSQDV